MLFRSLALISLLASIALAQTGHQADSSRTLDPAVLCTGCEAANPNATAGQAASLTSKNNFINFCAGQTITNGLQVKSGSCNPKNLDVIPANQDFTIRMLVQNLQTGTFTNAQKNYYAAPQQLNSRGVIIGHTHFVIQKIDSLGSTRVLDNTVFAFFKGIDAPAQNGVASQVVTGGLPAAVYRLASINAASNHQPVLAPIAQHGSMDDIVYFTVQDGNGNGNGINNDGGGNNNGGKNNGGSSSNGNGNGGNNNSSNNGSGNGGQGGGSTGQHPGGNLQTFTGALGGVKAPTVNAAGGGKFTSNGVTFNSAFAAVSRSCDVQNNQCADAANKSGNKNGFTVSACSQQLSQCQSSNKASTVSS